MTRLNKFLNYSLAILCFFFIPCLIVLFYVPVDLGVNFNDTKNVVFCCSTYIIIFLILLYICYRKDKNKMIPFVLLLFFNLLMRFFNMDIRSGDYLTFLSEWVENYRNLSFLDCFSSKVGNYSPPYNYFLILFSRIPLSELYLIKFLSFIFEILTAYYVCELIAFLTKKAFNKWIFLTVLSVPVFFINSVVWAQCDSIHTFLSFMAIYFAIKHCSKSSFLFFGLSLCFKFQSIILFPVALVLLLCGDEKGKFIKWRDLWIAPLVYVVVTGFSVLLGKSFENAFLIYFEQSVTYNLLSCSCVNLPLLFNIFNDNFIAKTALMIVFIILTLVVLFYVLFKYIRKKVITGYDVVNLSFFVSFLVVFFMPKMLDRYYYLSCVFAVVLIFVTSQSWYRKILCIIFLTSTIACFGFTVYASYIPFYFIVYFRYILFYIAALYNCMCVLILWFNGNKIFRSIEFEK